MFVVESWKNDNDERIIIEAIRTDNDKFGAEINMACPDFSKEKANYYNNALNNSLRKNKTHHTWLLERGFTIETMLTDDVNMATAATKVGIPVVFGCNDMSDGQKLIDNVKDVANVEVITKQNAPSSESVH